MPHVILDHAAAFDGPADEDAAMQIALDTCAETGVMQRADLKVRLNPAARILFGDGRSSFLHVTVLLLSGRTDAAKAGLAEALRSALDARFPKVQAISIDIRDMNREAYRKRLVDAS